MILRLIALLALTFSAACYRETAFQEFAVTATQSTDDNDEKLSVGTDTTGRRTDYILQNSNIQAVLNGNIADPTRDLFLPHSAGSIVDLSTQFRESGSRKVVSRDDDGLNQLSQGVNLNRFNLIGYHDIKIQQDSETEAQLILTGSVYDLDGSLAAAGAAVDPVDNRLTQCSVTTTLSLQETIPGATTDDDDTPVLYITATTVLTNTGSSTLPIFTVNDIAATTIGASNVFIPYPDWGYDIPSEDAIAYPLYVHLQPVQIDTAHYGMMSLLDGIVMARRDQDRNQFADYTYIGKARTPDSRLPGGEAITYIREFMAVNSGTSFSSGLRNIEAYREIAKVLNDNPPAGNPWGNTAGLSFQPDSIDYPGGTLVLNYIGQVDYFNGTQFVPLEEGRVYPWFGDRPLDTTYTFWEGPTDQREYLIPPGRFSIDVEALNNDPVNVRFRVDDNPDNPLEDVLTPIEVTTGEEFLLGSFNLGTKHSLVGFGLKDTNSRNIMGRVTFERRNGEAVTLGQFPRSVQGPFFYVNAIANQGTGTNIAVNALVPDGDFDLFATHGPLFEARILDLSVRREEFDPANPQGFALNLQQQITVDNLLSADFGLRSTGDPLGFTSLNQTIRMALAEDLDLVFFPDTNHADNAREFYRAVASTLGPFDQQDFTDDVNSLFDELAYNRAQATIGITAGEPARVGRFSIHNLPDEDEIEILQIPLVESDPAEFYDRVRAQFPAAVIHVTRPRAPRGFETGLLTTIADQAGLADNTPIAGDTPELYQTAATGSDTRWIDFDVMQLLSGNEYDDYLLARQDWFNLLNADIFRPVTGGSLVGQTRNLPIGTVRTWVQTTETALRDNDLADFWTSVREGRMMVSNGPLIHASINGADYGETTSASGGSVTIDLKIEAASWIPIREVRAVINGQVQVLDIPLVRGQPLRFDGQVSVDLPADRSNHWIVLEAGATLSEIANGTGVTGIFGNIYPEHLPIAFTNPIFINGGGN